MCNIDDLAVDISNATFTKLANKMNRLLELGKLSDDAVSTLESSGMLMDQKRLLKGISKGTKNIGKQYDVKHLNAGVKRPLRLAYAAAGISVDDADLDSIISQMYDSTGGAFTTTGVRSIKGDHPEIYSGVSSNAADLIEDKSGIIEKNRRLTRILLDRHEKNEGRAMRKLINYVEGNKAIPKGTEYGVVDHAAITGGHASPSVVAEESMLLRRLFPKGHLMHGLEYMRNKEDAEIYPTLREIGITPLTREIGADSKKELFSRSRKIDNKARQKFIPNNKE